MDSLTNEVQERAWSNLKRILVLIIAKAKSKMASRGVQLKDFNDRIAEPNEFRDFLDWIELYGDKLSPSYFIGQEEYHFELETRRIGMDEDVYAFRRFTNCIDSIANALSERDRSNLQTHISDLSVICDEMEVNIEDLYEDIDSCLAILDVQESLLIYVPSRPLIYIPDLLVQANDDLIRYIANKPDAIFGIAPRKFEELIAEIFIRKGFNVELTKATRDGGRDIVAIHQHLDIRTKYLIECKRYAKHNKISIAFVQRLLGVKIAESANKAILATTSTFTKDAKVFAQNHIWDLDLKDYSDIIAWIKQADGDAKKKV